MDIGIDNGAQESCHCHAILPSLLHAHAVQVMKLPPAHADYGEFGGAGTMQSEPVTIQQGTPWDEALPEPLRAALRNTPADFLRYILPGLIGRSAAAKTAAAAKSTSQESRSSEEASSNGASVASESSSTGDAFCFLRVIAPGQL